MHAQRLVTTPLLPTLIRKLPSAFCQNRRLLDEGSHDHFFDLVLHMRALHFGCLQKVLLPNFVFSFPPKSSLGGSAHDCRTDRSACELKAFSKRLAAHILCQWSLQTRKGMK
eukprot:TRINITY_DN9839_c0_g1_i2.p1 TRINITY_DN9839_c0_g1~~TRINITY_DN9839_c0_g1_i2.p1  ORF type:complete len:112 (-),score=8.94 TRINITY_DN9839_c0_g1_i2:9-344(-)